jgi:hypothetical protein
LIYRDAGEIGALLFVAQKVSEPSAPHLAREMAPSPAVAPVLDETPRD